MQGVVDKATAKEAAEQEYASRQSFRPPCSGYAALDFAPLCASPPPDFDQMSPGCYPDIWFGTRHENECNDPTTIQCGLRSCVRCSCWTRIASSTMLAGGTRHSRDALMIHCFLQGRGPLTPQTPLACSGGIGAPQRGRLCAAAPRPG